jgi:hypothetical protein
MGVEAMAMTEETGELGPLDKMNIWLKRSSLAQSCTACLIGRCAQEAEEALESMRKKSCEPGGAQFRQQKAMKLRG